MKNKIVIGSRGSILALAQSEMIMKKLQSNFPDKEFEIKIIVTSGDKDLVSNWNNSDKSLKSFFTKEIEQELLDGVIDLAVHSMKDMPIVSPEGLICGATPDREDNRDVIVSKNNIKLLDLPQEAIVGTSSLRRTMGLKTLRPDLQIKQLRGNIHTRLRKLDEGGYDAILLAAAGLKRVGLGDRITEELSYDLMMPAPAQGAL
ncbi:hydroxymethylbilane synthase, partial [uncultured Cetobacterium sp.]